MNRKLFNKIKLPSNESTNVSDKWHKIMGKFINWKYVAKFIVVIASFTGFFYQSSDYFVKYFEFPTFVDVKSERDLIIDIPSVTVCIPTLTSRPGLTAHKPEIIEKLAAIRNSGKNSSAVDEREMFRMYENLTAREVSPQRFFELGIHANKTIECQVLRPKYFDGQLNDTWIPCTNVCHVLETIGPYGKCFTYFTKLNQNGSQFSDDMYKIDVYKTVRDQVGLAMQLTLKVDARNYLDPAKFGDESITLHETTSVPSEGKRRRLKAGTIYDIYFTRTLTISQPTPFETDCISYRVFESEEPQSRVDCVDRCIKDIYYNDCGCYPLHVVVRHDIVINRNLSLCNDTNPALEKCRQKEVDSRCFAKCKVDCNEVSYDFDTEEDTYPSDSELSEAEGKERTRLQEIRNFTTVIKLWHKISGGTIYEYKQELPLIQLFSFVGGLASLWLGISIIAFYDFIVTFVTFVYKTKPFEKMRKRDAAVTALLNWSKNAKKSKLKAQPKIAVITKNYPKTPIVLNPK